LIKEEHRENPGIVGEKGGEGKKNVMGIPFLYIGSDRGKESRDGEKKKGRKKKKKGQKERNSFLFLGGSG